MALIVGFAELLAAFLLITKGIAGPNTTWADVLKGNAGKQIKQQEDQSSPTGGSTGSGATEQLPATGEFPSFPTTGTVSGTASEKTFAKSFLTAIGAPLNPTNIQALEDWWSREEGSNVLQPGHGGLNNPFEVTTSGNLNVPNVGTANSAGVLNFATPEAGVLGAIGYFEEYGPGVLEAFRRGESVSSIEAAVAALGPNAFGSDTATAWAS